jgi:hypothetical protein
MNTLRPLSAAIGFGCLVVGVIFGISGGTVAHVTALGNTLITAGAILVTGVLISSAIVSSGRKD